MISIEQQAKNIVNELAGCPTELKRRLRQIGVRYTAVNRGFHKVYILRGEKINRIEVRL